MSAQANHDAAIRDPWGEAYLALAFQLERLVPGLVDAYFGPPELRSLALAASQPDPARLAEDARRLTEALPAAGYDAVRQAFLHSQLRALVMLACKAAGHSVPLATEVEALFGVVPSRTAESEFADAIGELEGLLPGKGHLQQRLADWRARFVVPADRLLPLLTRIKADLLTRTRALLPLPDGESVEFALVTKRPWSGYNWYLGGMRSRVEVNTDLPVRVHTLPNLVAHETYPGHHTEHAVKERLLWEEMGRLENSIQLINTPECLISEGIASLALEAVFSKGTEEPWLAEMVLPAAGLDSAEAGRIVAIAGAAAKLRAVAGNAAFMLHEDGIGRAQVQEYLEAYGLSSPAEAAKRIEFLTDPLWRSYTFTYFYGERILRAWLDKVGWAAGFPRLLREPLTPGALLPAEVDS